MTLRERIASAVGIRAGEYLEATALFFYLMLVVASYTVSKTVRDALYISEYGALNLPYVYIAIAVLVGIFVSIYLRLAARIRQPVLLSLTLAFFLSNVVLFWWLSTYELRWLYAVIYIWAGIFGVIAPMQVWMLANFVLTTRQAKRLFGFVGAGGVMGGIAGGFAAGQFGRYIGTEQLLLVIAGFLGLCIVLVNVAWMKSGTRAAQPRPKAQDESAGTLRETASVILSSRYLMLVAGIISVSSIATTIADFQFKAVAETAFSSKQQLTIFFGDFYGYLGAAAFLFQMFVTARLLRGKGVGFTLLLLPVGLMLGEAALLLYVSLWSAIVLKGSDQLFKHSVDKSTVELLYLPVPQGIKPGVKSFIDTVLWRLADGAAGILLLLLTSVLAFGVRGVAVANMVIVGFWIFLAVVARREYVGALRAAVYRRPLTADLPPPVAGPAAPGPEEGEVIVPRRDAAWLAIEAELTKEIADYYAALDTAIARGSRASRAPRKMYRLELKMKRIFRLLGLMYAPEDLRQAYFSINSRDPIRRANAVEFLDNVLRPRHRRVVLPILEWDFSVLRSILRRRKKGAPETLPEAEDAGRKDAA